MAWDDIDLSQKIELFEVRTKIGKERQPEWSSHLDSLGNNIKHTKVYDSKGKLIETPYEEFSKQLFDNFCNCENDFKNGGNWINAAVNNSNFFYRIETLSSFKRKHLDYFSNYTHSVDAFDINPRFQSDENIFEFIFNAYMQKSDWIDLDVFVTTFLSPRNISWWTNDFEFENKSMFPKEIAGNGLSYKHKWILDFAFKVGLSSDWLSDNLLFLRLDSNKIDKDNFKVPSVIDAYTQPIFSPQKNQNPKFGKAFDLANDIKPKTREFVVKDIPIDAISFIPVKINEKELNSINPQPRLTKSLVENLIRNI